MRIQTFLIGATLIMTIGVQDGKAADPVNAGELKMREMVRNTMLQLRDAQNQITVLQASESQAEGRKKELASQVEALTKQNADDKETSTKAVNDLNAKIAELTAETTRLQGSLDKWKIGYKEAADLARTKEEQRARLGSTAASLQNRVDDQQARNLEMYKVAREILGRYERFSLGDALVAREPFTGIARAKLDGLIQDYRDKLTDQKIGPAEGRTAAQKAKP